MHVNRAELGIPHEALVDLSKPFLVTSVGYYRMVTHPLLHTQRLEGREDYQIIYVAGGCGHFLIDGKYQTLPQGRVVLYRPGEVQDYYVTAEEKAEYYWCHFTGSEVESLLDSCGIPRNQQVFEGGADMDYSWLFFSMLREMQMQQPRYNDILMMDISHILLLIARPTAAKIQHDNRMLGEIDGAVRTFNHNYRFDISIKDYAEQHLMSPFWFSKKFKEATGSSPRQYIIMLRIADAKNLLDSTDYTVTEIADMVGYDQAQYFHRLFRRYTGMTPQEYRKRNRKKE